MYIRHCSLPKICDANNKFLHMVGTVKFPVKLGNFYFHIDFIICQSLAAPAIFDADFCGRFVEAIRPRKKLIEPNEVSTLPIVKRPMKRIPTSPLPS